MHLTYRGELDEALAESRRAQELDPLSFIINDWAGSLLHYSCRYEEALEQLRKNVELFPNNAMAHSDLGQTYVEIGKYEKAIVELEKAVALAENVQDYKAKLGYVYAKSGRRVEAEGIIKELANSGKQKCQPNVPNAILTILLTPNSVKNAELSHYHLQKPQMSPKPWRLPEKN